MDLKNLILLLNVIKLINCFTFSELFTIFGDRNCIPGSLASLTENSKSPIDYFPDEFLTQETLITDSNNEDKSALSSLHELAQFNDISYSYELINTEGPPHNRIFTVTLNLGDEYFTSDDGMKSIKKAQQNAAIKALKSTQYQHAPLKIKRNNRDGETLTTPSAALNNLATKLGLKVTYNLVTEEIIIESNNNDDDLKLNQKSYLEKLNDTVHGNDSIHIRKDGDNSDKGPFTMSVDVNGARFFGKAHTKQQARHEAASKALKSLKDMPEIFQCLNEDDNCKSKRKNHNKSPISLVYEEAQRRKLAIDFEIIDEIGPAHKKIFTTKCTVGGKLLESIGEGKSKKESKRKAAENILSDLLNLPDKTTAGENSNNNAQENLKKKKKSKKNKVIKNTFDKIDKIFDNVMDFGKDLVEKFTGGEHQTENDDKRKGDSKKKTQFTTPTEELLHYGKLLNINVQFSDFEENEKSYSLLDLNTKTSILCLGEGVNQKNSRDLASKYGLKILYKLGLLDNLQKETKIISDGLINTEKASKSVWFPTEENVDKDEL